MKCKNCNEKNLYKAHYCQKCGYAFTEEDRKEAYSQTIFGFFDKIEEMYKKIKLDNITGNMYFKVLSILFVLAFGLFNVLSNGNAFKVLDSEQYDVQYNTKTEEYYLITEEDMVQKVYETKPDALIIDYKLSSQQNIAYTGISLASAIDAKLHDFPIFILTSFQDDVFSKECFDVYQVFDFERYIGDQKERLEINSKIVEQIRKYNRTILQWKSELAQLLPLRGSNVSVDERIVELDTWIENSIDGTSALSPKMKRDLDSNHIQALIAKIDSIINEG